jgi:hypothetical protein
MKKITSKEDITFRVNAQTVLEITKKGCLCSDEDAALAKERLGNNIQVEEVKVEDEVKKAKKEEAEAKKAEEEAKKAEEKAAKEAAKKAATNTQ